MRTTAAPTNPRATAPRTFIGTPQVIDFTTRSGRIERRLMYPVRVHPSVDADMPIVRWSDRDEDRAVSR
jgi:hypothetical protein